VQLTDTVLHIFEWTGVTAIERTGVTAIHAYAADSLWDERREHIVIMGIYDSTLVFCHSCQQPYPGVCKGNY
jgi:hypothetical protein